VDRITVTDQAYKSGSLSFQSVCGGGIFPLACQPAAPSGWVSGFDFPYFDSIADVSLVFQENLLPGPIHIVQGTADQEYRYEGSGLDWTATWIDAFDTFTGTGHFVTVPEPATIALLVVLGLSVGRGLIRGAPTEG